MRSTGFGRLFVTVAFGLAVLAVDALPAWGQDQQPIDGPATSGATERALEDLGYGVAITYRLGHVDTVVVRYRGGPESPALAERQIIEAVWQHEPYRFARLDVEPVGGESSSYTYDELAALLGPRPPGLDAVSLDEYEASVRASTRLAERWAENQFLLLVLVVILVGGGLFFVGACIALGGWAASKQHRLRPTASIR
jgi:hypothetical protein